jgi:hypothetical protein
MPVSKKPRKKQSKLPSLKWTSSAVALPDRRAMEGLMSAFGGRPAHDALATAQQVMYEAWDKSSSRARVALSPTRR